MEQRREEYVCVVVAWEWRREGGERRERREREGLVMVGCWWCVQREGPSGTRGGNRRGKQEPED